MIGMTGRIGLIGLIGMIGMIETISTISTISTNSTNSNTNKKEQQTEFNVDKIFEWWYNVKVKEEKDFLGFWVIPETFKIK